MKTSIIFLFLWQYLLSGNCFNNGKDIAKLIASNIEEAANGGTIIFDDTTSSTSYISKLQFGRDPSFACVVTRVHSDISSEKICHAFQGTDL